MSAPLLQADALSVAFPVRGGVLRREVGRVRAVERVSVAVDAGEVLGIVGESGCGKTTLARTILGLERPRAGEVRFRGERVRYDGRALRRYRRAVQMVFQDPTGALNARQTVYEAVAEGLRIQKVEGDEEQLVAAALARSGLRPPAVLRPVPVRDLGRAAPARRDRGRDGP